MSEHHEQYQHEAEETVNAEAAQNPNTEQPEAAEPPTYEELQARIAELEGQLKDSELRGLANEQTCAAAINRKSPIRTSLPDKNSPPKCCRSKTISKWRCSTKAAISTR